MANQTKTLTIGSDSSSLDIFLSDANNIPVTANYVGFELFDASNTSVVSGIATNPQAGKYAASGVIPSVSQVVDPGTNVLLGDWRINWDIITSSNTLQRGSEQFCVQDVTVKIGFVPSTSKTFEIYDAIRVDLGADDGSILTDSLLERTVVKSVRRLNRVLGLSHTSRPKGVSGGFGSNKIKVSPIVFDKSAGTITPNNDEICDLVVLQSEYILATSEMHALKRLSSSGTGPFASVTAGAAQDGISVTNADGVTVTISGGRLGNRVALHRDLAKGLKEELDAAIKAFLGRMTGNFGKLIW